MAFHSRWLLLLVLSLVACNRVNCTVIIQPEADILLQASEEQEAAKEEIANLYGIGTDQIEDVRVSSSGDSGFNRRLEWTMGQVRYNAEFVHDSLLQVQALMLTSGATVKTADVVGCLGEPDFYLVREPDNEDVGQFSLHLLFLNRGKEVVLSGPANLDPLDSSTETEIDIVRTVKPGSLHDVVSNAWHGASTPVTQRYVEYWSEWPK